MSDPGVISNLELGAAIRRRRRELALSQDDLAYRLNVSYQQVQRYETGKNILNVEYLQRIARALCVPVGYFFTQVPADEVVTTITLCGSEDEGELLALYRKIQPRENKSLVTEFTRLVAGEPPREETVAGFVEPKSLRSGLTVNRKMDEERRYDSRLFVFSQGPL